MDNLHSFGLLQGSLGGPGNNRRGQLNPGPVQAGRPVRSGTRVPTGQQLGDAGLQLVKGSFLRNLRAVVGHVTRTMGTRGDLAADSGGFPDAPTVTGWDGEPLDRFGKL